MSVIKEIKRERENINELLNNFIEDKNISISDKKSIIPSLNKFSGKLDDLIKTAEQKQRKNN